MKIFKNEISIKWVSLLIIMVLVGGAYATTNPVISNAISYLDSLVLTTPLAVTSGGTGASTAAVARANLGANDASNLTTGTLANDRLSASVSNFNESYSYLIYIDGTTVYAKNGTTGVIDFSGSNASMIINNAINRTGTPSSAGIFGGTVMFKKGRTDFNITTSIIVKRRVNLIAEKDTVLKGGAVFGSIFEAAVSSPQDMQVTISGFRLEGMNLVGAGIIISNSSFIYVDNNEIAGMTGYGIHIKGGALYNKISNNIIQAPLNGYGIMVTRGAGYNVQSGENQIIKNNIHGRGIGIMLSGDVIHNTVENNVISSNATQGIYVIGDTTFRPMINIIRNNWLELGTYENIRAIQVQSDTPTTMPFQTVIEQNHIGLYGIGIFLFSDNASIVRDNYFADNTQNINIGSASKNQHIDNYGIAPYNWGNNAAAPTPFGVGDIYYNTSANRPCYRNATTWNTYANVGGC